MRFIDEIDTDILLALPDKQLRLNGLAEPIVLRGDSDEIFPVVLTTEGEGLHVFNDESDIGIYHRITRKTYAYESVKGYGDTKRRTSLYNVSMVVWGNRQKVTDFHTLESLITTKISRYADVTDVNFNRLQVFGEEFMGVPFFLQPNIFLFKINYKVKSTESRCE